MNFALTPMNFVFQMMNLGIRTDQSAATGVILRRSTSPIHIGLGNEACGGPDECHAAGYDTG